MIIQGDALKVLSSLDSESVQCCITSPPYYSLRDYGVEGQIGLEETPESYVERLAQVFREVHRVLRDNGTLWLNLGDTYLDKQLAGIPWRVAFALQANGWILRQDIIWNKTSCMPEPVKDRCTKSHEYIFLLSKNQDYYYDADAIKTPVKQDWGTRDRTNGKYRNAGLAAGLESSPTMSNKRDVWHIPTAQLKEAHFATFPEELVETCIRAGTKEQDLVLDPFSGAGTTGVVAAKLLRKYVGIELNPEYVKLSEERIAKAAAQNRLFS